MAECTECGRWVDADCGECEWHNDKPYAAKQWRALQVNNNQNGE